MDEAIVAFLHGVWAHPCVGTSARMDAYRLSGTEDVAYADGCDLRQHARLHRDEITSLTDGVMVNAVRLPPGESRRLRPTDEVTLLQAGAELARYVFDIEAARPENYAAAKNMTP